VRILPSEITCKLVSTKILRKQTCGQQIKGERKKKKENFNSILNELDKGET